MTLAIGRVPGAADSGTRYMPSRAREPKQDWTCVNGHSCKGYWTRCLQAGCNAKRA